MRPQSPRRLVVLALVPGLLLWIAGCEAGPQTISAAGYGRPSRIDAPRSGLPSLRVAAAALDSGIPAVALSIAQRHLAENQNDVSALLLEGSALAALGKGKAAEAVFRHVAAIEPHNDAARMGLGRVLLVAGQAADAEAAFRLVLAGHPDDARAATDLGIALDLQGRSEEAQASYLAALAAAPDMDAARVDLALSYALSGHATQGVDILRPLAASAGASGRVKDDLALALAAAGDQAGARSLLKQNLAPGQVSVAMDAYLKFAEEK